MVKLFEPWNLKGVKARNRICVSPMCQYATPDGVANPWHLVHLGSRAVGGAGIVMVEATAVAPEGRITPMDLGLWNDAQATSLSPIVSFLSEQGAIPAIQIAHAGRKASTAPPFDGGAALSSGNGGWTTVGPSALSFGVLPPPRPLEISELDKIREDFRSAAVRARLAGFKVLEIHMAHGYLLNSFLSPLSNRRTDRYGGSLENRMRFPLEVLRTVRSVWPDECPLWVRISATDWVEGGWEIGQSVVLAKALAEEGVDVIDCSSGGIDPMAHIPVGPGYQTPLAAEVRREAKVSVVAVGMITDPVQAEHILVTGQADAVSLAREILRDPYWPLHAANRLGADMTWPIRYERAKPKGAS